MTLPAALTLTLPLERLAPGDALIREGSRSGRLFVLESGMLSVTRDGVELAIIAEPGAIVGEIAVLLGIPHSATVVARTPAGVRVVEDALAAMAQHPDLAIHVATTLSARLNATSALLVELQHAARGRKREEALVGRILASLSAAQRGRRADHE